jgi:CMP-N-acetylneuraminic acid synthetase
MKIFIILKEKSQRVKNKNFIKFSNIELYKKVLYKFKDFQLFIDTDSDKIIKDSKLDRNLSHCFFYKRNKEFVIMENNNEKSPTPFMIKNFLENFVKDKNEIVVTTHVTSPFLKINTLKKAILKMKKWDSVSSCIQIQNFSYLENNKKFIPINFNKKIIQKTQNLQHIIHLIGAFFIIKKNIFLENGLQRISSKNYFYPLDFPENIDIDNYSDLSLALKVEKFLKFL